MNNTTIELLEGWAEILADPELELTIGPVPFCGEVTVLCNCVPDNVPDAPNAWVLVT